MCCIIVGSEMIVLNLKKNISLEIPFLKSLMQKPVHARLTVINVSQHRHLTAVVL